MHKASFGCHWWLHERRACAGTVNDKPVSTWTKHFVFRLSFTYNKRVATHHSTILAYRPVPILVPHVSVLPTEFVHIIPQVKPAAVQLSRRALGVLRETRVRKIELRPSHV
jgi:hypothetical protein